MVTVPTLPYDPEARRDTPLALKLKAQIRRSGPISTAEYMRACLHDPVHGYYQRMPAIGAGGDFITAPEISQVFGELIGLWCCVAWQQMGAPQTVHLVELGPGRGTMMKDALRAARVVPGFVQAARVHLVESNAHLKEVQAETLGTIGLQPRWMSSLSELEIGPTILLGNEFLDTCDVHQHEFPKGQMYQRGVGLDGEGRLKFLRRADYSKSLDPNMFAAYSHMKPGDIIESQDFTCLSSLDRLRGGIPLTGLFIDYGHLEPTPGESLQALRDHLAEHPLTSPGEADLSVQVDFAEFGLFMQTLGFATHGPVTQAEFLGRLGIVERASRLMAANPARAAEIEAGVARLIAPNAMGSRFKAIGVRSAHLPPLPGF